MSTVAHPRPSMREVERDARYSVGTSWTRFYVQIATVLGMGRRRLRPSELSAVYPWYDRDSGLIDLIGLAQDSMTGVRTRPTFAEPPGWIRGLGLPTRLPEASLPDLARLSGIACRAWVEAGRPGFDR